MKSFEFIQGRSEEEQNGMLTRALLIDTKYLSLGHFFEKSQLFAFCVSSKYKEHTNIPPEDLKAALLLLIERRYLIPIYLTSPPEQDDKPYYFVTSSTLLFIPTHDYMKIHPDDAAVVREYTLDQVDQAVSEL